MQQDEEYANLVEKLKKEYLQIYDFDLERVRREANGIKLNKEAKELAAKRIEQVSRMLDKQKRKLIEEAIYQPTLKGRENYIEKILNQSIKKSLETTQSEFSG